MNHWGLWRCPSGYLYNPMLGAPKGGIKSGVSNEDLPPDWKMPFLRLAH
ncbi:MAG: rubredoxin [Nitrospinae bacterium]|nr:rubredoxin [Nitrospinota bacterium]